jgi:hypothetical protein
MKAYTNSKPYIISAASQDVFSTWSPIELRDVVIKLTTTVNRLGISTAFTKDKIAIIEGIYFLFNAGSRVFNNKAAESDSMGHVHYVLSEMETCKISIINVYSWEQGYSFLVSRYDVETLLYNIQHSG